MTKLIRKAPVANNHNYKSDDYMKYSTEYRRMFETMVVAYSRLGINVNSDDKAFVDLISLAYSKSKVYKIAENLD